MKFSTGMQNKISARMLWALTILTGVFTFVNTSQITPNDFWWHMAVGREIVDSRQIPSVDIYSHTMTGQLYPSYKMFWLMDVWLYGWYSLGGPELILFIHSMIIAGTYLVILLLCWQDSKKWGVTSVCLLFAIVLGIYAWNLRPQAVSFLIGSIFLYSIYAYRRRPNPAWLAVFPVGMLVWVNSHGSFPIGLVLIGIWFGDEIWQVWRAEGDRSSKPLQAPIFALLLTGLVCLINPRGAEIVTYIATMVSNPAVQTSVPEWAAPSFDSPIGPFFFTGILLTAAILALSPRRPTFFQMAMFIGFVLLGLSTTRGVIWYGLVMAPILAMHISAILDSRHKNEIVQQTQKRTALINLALLVLIISLAVISLPWFRSLVPMPEERQKLITQDTPIEATKFLTNQSLPQKIFNDMGFGSYLIWAAQPEYKVFVDPRIELFPQEIWTDYHMISNAIPGWEKRLEDHGARTLMLNTKSQGPLIEAVGDSDQWSLIYQDRFTRIFNKIE
jgi:hypothetical protein